LRNCIKLQLRDGAVNAVETHDAGDFPMAPGYTAMRAGRMSADAFDPS
jgi:hypothetical protein